MTWLRRWLARPAVQVAPELLGWTLRHHSPDGVVAVRLSEVEAYLGSEDPGSHAYRGRTARNAVMFGPAGHMYVYFTYGMHFCANVVCGESGAATAVLLRAGEIVRGRDLAKSRRRAARSDRELARGPARLASALGLGRAADGVNLCAEEATVTLLAPEGAAPTTDQIRCGGRVGVAGPGGDGAHFPWRFWLADDPTVSVYRAHVPRKPGKRS